MISCGKNNGGKPGRRYEEKRELSGSIIKNTFSHLSVFFNNDTGLVKICQ